MNYLFFFFGLQTDKDRNGDDNLGQLVCQEMHSTGDNVNQYPG